MRGLATPRTRFGGANRFTTRAAFRRETEILVRDFRDLRATFPSPEFAHIQSIRVIKIFTTMFANQA
jgi:hypothetical protein